MIEIGDAGAGQTRDLQEADELVDPGDREVEEFLDVLAIQPGPILENVAQRTPVLRQPSRKRAARVEFERVRTAAQRPQRSVGS